MLFSGSVQHQSGDVLQGFLTMKSAYHSHIYLEELKHSLNSVGSHQVEVGAFVQFITALQSELISHNQKLQSRVEEIGLRKAGGIGFKERCQRIRERNQSILLQTLNLRQSLVTLMPKNRAYEQGYENELGRILDKIRFSKARTLQKINQVKYSRANRHPTSQKAPSCGVLVSPLSELKKASEVLSKRTLCFYEQLKELIKWLQR